MLDLPVGQARTLQAVGIPGTPASPNSSMRGDFVEGLPVSEGFGTIMVVVDRFTKFATHFKWHRWHARSWTTTSSSTASPPPSSPTATRSSPAASSASCSPERAPNCSTPPLTTCRQTARVSASTSAWRHHAACADGCPWRSSGATPHFIRP